VDLDRGTGGAEYLFQELATPNDESEVAWRSGTRHVPRLTGAPAGPMPNAENYALENAQRGTLDRLQLVAASRRAPREGEVEISVRASGLNFKDVISALGVDVTSGKEASLEAPLGSECAGVIAAVGPGVDDIRVGDHVMALAAGSFRRWVTVDRRFVVPMPPGLSFVQACTIPVAFLTAWYALHDLARLEAEERLLVHSAAGGVGMAATQVAHSIGAEVFGTASPAKWDTLRSLGIEHMASSRNLEFVAAFRACTDEAGVDVVLNSLAREYVDAGLSLLSDGGRFIEMGMTDIRDAESVSAHRSI
jgi:polyketide synthase 12/epothilone polyketide synthase D